MKENRMYKLELRCPYAKLNRQTPHEAWSGKKPCVSHLKVFGSVAYAQIQCTKPSSRTKMRRMNGTTQQK